MKIKYEKSAVKYFDLLFSVVLMVINDFDISEKVVKL